MVEVQEVVNNVGVGFGQAVVWSQLDGGQLNIWEGGVIAFVPAGDSAKALLPEKRLKGTRTIFRRDIEPEVDRFLIVAVNPVRRSVEFHCRSTNEVETLPWKYELPKYTEG